MSLSRSYAAWSGRKGRNGFHLFIHPAQVFLDQFGYRKLVGAAGRAYTALGAFPAFFDAFPVVPLLQNSFPHPFDHGTDPQDHLNGNLFRTGLAVITPTAEDLFVTLLGFLDLLFLLLRQPLPFLEDLPVFIDELLLFHPGNDQDPRLRKGIFQGQPGAFDKPTGERFHRDHPDILFSRLGDNLFRSQRFEKAEADHDRVEEPVIEGMVQYVQTVAADPNVADQSLLPGLVERFQSAPPGAVTFR